MKNKNILLVVALITCLNMSIGCLSIGNSEYEESTYDELYGKQVTETPAFNYSAILEEANRLNDTVVAEIKYTEDLEQMLSPDKLSDKSDESDIFLIVEQKQKEDVVTWTLIKYVKENQYTLDTRSSTGTWATEVIEAYEYNIELNEVWYCEVEEVFDTTIDRPKYPVSHTVIGEPSDERTTDTDYEPPSVTTPRPTGQTELSEEYIVKLERLAHLTQVMSEEMSISTQTLTCSSSLQISISACRDYTVYFRDWTYQNRYELEIAGAPPMETSNLLFDQTFLLCDQMDDVCIQLQSIPKY